MSEGEPAGEIRYAKFTGKSRVIITEQTDQSDKEWEVLKNIKSINADATIQEAIRLLEAANKKDDFQLQDNNLKKFYENTSFVLKKGSIEDFKMAAYFWNTALKKRRSIHERKRIILTNINWDSGKFGRVKDQEQITEKELIDFEKEEINDSVYNTAKEGLQKAFTGQAELKKALETAISSAR